MVNHQEQQPAEDRVTIEGWLLIIAVILSLTLSVNLQLERAAGYQGSHTPEQIVRVAAW